MAQKKIKYILGSDATISIYFKDKETGDPIDMSGFTSSALKVRKNDSTLLSISGALDSADLAKVDYVISDTVGDTFMVGDDQDFHVELVRGSDTQKFLYENILSVKAVLV